ncbi:nuclease-related domain-containing protein [Psychrobacillus vulpis]|uniref:NERD domain-containing protein n=1 Tax=Psychrobacillus vulpis TaxID=2325572 RepID=A0A544TLV1_9BACI|nr:nuclease-related domain-containing protein [Psychrobacillus vulpis]TQR18398.1 NERD domain-containing protein [Psychrobacillus vulpis]
MIVKGYEKSSHLEAMETLLKRLPPNHPLYTKIATEIRITKAGDFGEEIVFRELEKMQLPFEYLVFHKVLLHGESAFELDILLITPFGAIILEVKNIIGELEFQENPSQLVQQKETGEVNKYACPAIQLNEYKYQLSQFFIDQNIPIQIYGAVVFAARNSFVKVTTNKAKILYRNEVRSFLRKFQHSNPTHTGEDIEKIKDVLLKKITPFNYFPLTKYFSINPNELVRGVECLTCGFIGMYKVTRTWICPKCRKSDPIAYKHAIHTYFHLFKDSITNKECRDFLQLNNRHEANRILTNFHLNKTGSNKSTQYKMPLPNR